MATRIVRKRRNRKRNRKAFLALVTLACLVFIGFTGYEYLAGKSQAFGKIHSESIDQNGTISGESEFKNHFKGVDNQDGITTSLVLGVDQRGSEVSRTDTIMITQYDPEQKSVKIASIMRDTYVNIPGHGYNKINAAFAIGGPELLRQTISDNFGIELEYYSIVDFDGFTQIIDTLAPEGLNVDVEKDMEYHSQDTDISLNQGNQSLNGKELLEYARFRSDQQGDFGRVERQQKVIRLLTDEMLSFTGVMKTPRLIGTLQPYIETNIGNGKMIDLCKDFLLNPADTIETTRVPNDDNVWNERKEYPIGLVLAHDEEKTKQNLKEFFNQSS